MTTARPGSSTRPRRRSSPDCGSHTRTSISRANSTAIASGGCGWHTVSPPSTRWAIPHTAGLGFAYPRSSAGISSSDMRDLFRLSGMFDISTTFSPTLYSDEPGIVADPRLQTLNTPWDQALLVAKSAAATAAPLNGRDALQKEENTFAFIQQDGGTMLAGSDSPLHNVATALRPNLPANVPLGHLPPAR